MYWFTAFLFLIFAFNNAKAQTQLGQSLYGNAGEQAGYYNKAVALNQNVTILAFGAPVNGKFRVKIYQLVSGTWQQLGNDIIGENNADQFGFSISLNITRNRIAIGVQ